MPVLNNESVACDGTRTMSSRLRRSRSDEVVGGVCGGLADFLGMDSNLVRLLFILLALVDGVGVFIYCLLSITVPSADKGPDDAGEAVDGPRTAAAADRSQGLARGRSNAARSRYQRVGVTGGCLMIALGYILLIQNLGLGWLRWLGIDTLGPLLVVVLGAMLLVHSVRGEWNGESEA